MSGMSNVWKHWLGPVRIPWEEGKIKWTTCRTLGESVTTAGWVWFWVPTCAAPPSGGLVWSPLPRWLLRMGLATQASPVATHLLVCLHSLLLLHPSKSNLFFPLLLFLSWHQPFQNFPCAQSSSQMGILYINHALSLDILLGQKPFFLLPPSRLGIHLVCWIICNDRATPQINFTQICFRCFPKARSKPVNW